MSSRKHWPDGAFVIAPAGVGTGKYYGRVLRSDPAYASDDDHNVRLDYDWTIIEIEVEAFGTKQKQTTRPIRSDRLRQWPITMQQRAAWTAQEAK